ncbi:MAG TPA: hypothetical protein VGK73_11315 [Polyangiaceae bacterium]
MANVAATIKEITLVEGAHGSIAHATTGQRKTYRVTFATGTQTAGDVAVVVTLNEKIAAITKNGRTVTLRDAVGCGPGLTPGGTAAYASIPTVDGTTLSFTVGGPTAAAVVAALTGANLFVTVDEA